MTAVSAVNPLRVAVAAVLETTSVGTNVFHEGETSRNTPMPYLVLATATENDDAAKYMQPGNEGTLQIKCWAQDSWDSQELYAEIRAKLHQQPLPLLNGHTLVEGSVTRLEDFPEPDPEVGGHVTIAQYRTRTLVV